MGKEVSKRMGKSQKVKNSLRDETTEDKTRKLKQSAGQEAWNPTLVTGDGKDKSCCLNRFEAYSDKKRTEKSEQEGEHDGNRTFQIKS